MIEAPRRGGVVWGGVSPSPENFGTFSLEMAHFGANSVVYFNRNVRLFTAIGPRSYSVLLAADGVLLLGIVPVTVSESLNGWSEALTLTVGLAFKQLSR